MLITGISGLLGNNLACYFRDKYEIVGLYNYHPVTIRGIRTEYCDISNHDSVWGIIREVDPSIIIHCASLTNVEECEQQKSITKDINVIATGNIVECTKNQDVKLIYISTDSVYDGTRGNFSEADKPNPLNYYGQTKFEGELEVAKKDNSLIFRTNIFGWNIQDKKSLGEWILGELEANRQINGFRDAFFSSIYTMEFARVIDIAVRMDLKGTYNCGTSDSCSKYEFAKKIAARFGFSKKLITPISIDDFGFKAKRGKKLTLNTAKIQKDIDYRLPTIDQSIESFYRDYKCRMPQDIKLEQKATEEISSHINYGRQCIDHNDIQAVVRTLRSERITQGPEVEEFENRLVEYCGAKYAVAVNSGTAALHLACLVSDIKEGDEVITSPNTFVASANCAVYCGAKPVFSDISLKTYNILPDEIGAKINNRTRAVVPVHFAGQSCEMDSVYNLVKKKEEEFSQKIMIIEDASHAMGSFFKGKKVGACSYADMTTMSFHPVKHITTGEGGAILTNNEQFYNKLRRLRNHGITKVPIEMFGDDVAYQPVTALNKSELNPWYYEQIDLGHNYRITDIQCALGLSQLKKLESFRNRRREIVDMYNQAFQGTAGLQVPYESEHCNTNFHLYVVLIDFVSIGISRAEVMKELERQGIYTQVHYIPVHTQPYFQKKYHTGWGDCPNAEQYYQNCLSLPLFPLMTDSDTKRVISAIKKVLV